MLKTILASLWISFLTLTPAARCDAQQPPAPQLTCPPVQLRPKNAARNYKTLNRSAPVSVTTYTDLNSKKNPIVPGTWCYIVQAVRNGHKSPPSNMAMITVPAGKHKVVLSWNAPPDCAGCTYILSRTAAVATKPTAPAVRPAQKKGEH
jgi:hypothetical protein